MQTIPSSAPSRAGHVPPSSTDDEEKKMREVKRKRGERGGRGREVKKSKNEEGGEIRGIEKRTRRRIEEKMEAKGNLVGK